MGFKKTMSSTHTSKKNSNRSSRKSSRPSKKSQGCRDKWVEETQVKICRKVEKVRQEKRCRTIVLYRPVIKRVKITIQEVQIRDEIRTKCVDDAFCTKVCKWFDVCVNGKKEDECAKSKCCSGKWVAAKREKICHDKKVSCPQTIEYIEQIPYIVERHEFVEVEIQEAYFEQEEYFVDVVDCETICEWKEETFPEPPQVCPTC